MSYDSFKQNAYLELDILIIYFIITFIQFLLPNLLLCFIHIFIIIFTLYSFSFYEEFLYPFTINK